MSPAKISLSIIPLALLLVVGQASSQTHLWKFDEGTGSTSFDSVHTANSVNAILNSATWQDLSKIGPGAAVRITGADNSFVSFGSSIGKFGTKAFSVAFWVQTIDTLANYDLIGNRADPSHGNFLAIRMSGDGFVSAEVDQDSAGTNYIGIRSSQNGLNDGNWHHIVVTRSGKTLALYIDGQLSNSGTGAGVANINNGKAFKLGRSLVDANTARFAPAALFDDVAIYNQAISASQVKSLYRRATNQ